MLRFVSTQPDTFGTSPQVGGSLLDSRRREQTTDSCLGVKGSPVHVRSSGA